MKIRHLFRFVAYTAATFVAIACEGGQGAEFMDWIVWAGNNTTLLMVLVVAATPFIAMIPGVGVPVSLIVAKIGTTLIPVLKEVAKAVEQDKRKDRSVGESAGAIVGKLSDDRDSLIGKIPGLGLAANIAAASVVRRGRRLKKKSGSTEWPIF